MKRILLAGLTFSLPFLAQAAPGDLDTNFAGTGTLRLGFGLGDDHGRAAVVQADGKLVVGGYTGPYYAASFALVRYTTNNALDPSFGQGGKVITPIGRTATLSAVQIQSDGKIVAAGTVTFTNSTYESALVRYNDDGSLDTNFNGTGILTPTLSGHDSANALGIQADGKIVVAGDSNNVLAVLRFNPDSTLDTNFNGGIVVNAFSEYSGANAVLFQSDGKLLVAGYHSSSVALLRFTTNGVLDSSFNSTGIAQSPTGGASDSFVASSIAIQPGGISILQPAKILVAGWAEIGGTQQEFLVARYNLDGTLDTSFAGTGYVTTPMGLAWGQASAVLSQGFVLQPRKIVVAGYGWNGSQSVFALARFTSVGALDTSFGGTGQVFTPISNGGSDYAYGMVGQGGDLVVVGETTPPSSNGDFAIVHYHSNDGSLDTNYNGTGITIQDISDVPAYGRCVGIQADGKIVVAGYVDSPYNETCGIARLNPDGSLDPTFGSSGKFAFSPGTQGGAPNALAIQADGRIVLAGGAYGSFESFFAARLTTNGRLDGTFGTNGVVITSFGTNAYALGVALQSDGKIIVVGPVYTGIGFDWYYGVARYQSNGSLDTSFHGHGTVLTEIGTDGDWPEAVAIQRDGGIIVSGYSYFGRVSYFSIDRYNADGNLDLGFGELGRVISGISAGQRAEAIAMALQADGNIVLAGGSSTSSNSVVALMRFNDSGTLDTNFNGSGQVTNAVGPSDNYAEGVALQSNGKIVVAASVTVGTNDRFTALRYNPSGSLDSSYGTGGVVPIDFGTGAEEECDGMALDASERAVLVGSVNGLVGVARVMGDVVLKIRSISRLPNGHMLLQGSGVANATHTLQSSSNPRSASFSALAPVSVDAGGLWQYEDTSVTGSNVRFYRLSYP